MSDLRPSLCRICSSYCPILVEVEDGRAVQVTGDPSAPLYQGYTCPKGRTLPSLGGREPYNPACMHPDDLAALQLDPSRIRLNQPDRISKRSIFKCLEHVRAANRFPLAPDML